MKIFFAGSDTNIKDTEVINSLNGNRLLSFFYLKQVWKSQAKIKEILNLKNKLFIDSGAFSAFSLGSKIDIDNYIKFCKETDADYYAVLDVIGDAEGTLQNQKYMVEQGVNPVPCFHYGEDFKYLDYYCKNYDFVALGGMVPISTPNLVKWLDVIFTKYPNHKFHGFGLTSKLLVNRYPWFSVDSSSWLMGGRLGNLICPELGTTYYLTLNEQWKKKILSKGFTIEEIQKNHYKRHAFNVMGFLELQNNHKPYFKINQHQLADFGFDKDTYYTMQKNKRKEKTKEDYVYLTKKYENPFKIMKEYKCHTCNERFHVSKDGRCFEEVLAGKGLQTIYPDGVYPWTGRCTYCNSSDIDYMKEVRT